MSQRPHGVRDVLPIENGQPLEIFPFAAFSHGAAATLSHATTVLISGPAEATQRVTSRLDAPRFEWIVFALTAVAARAITVGSPLLHVDETFYLTVAQAMTRGALPYVDLWDRKPIGLFLLYVPAAAWGLPASLYVYQVMAAVSVVTTAALVARLVGHAGWRAGALPAGIFYILWLNLADGQGGQSPVFYNALMGAAALLVLRASRARSRAPGLTAMLLVGLALQIKYSVVFEGIGFGLYLLFVDWRQRHRPGATICYGAVLCALALLPTAAAMATYAALGHLDAFVFANFVSILQRGHDGPVLMAAAASDAAAILSLLALALVGWSRDAANQTERDARLFLRLWLLTAVLAFLGFGGWYNHYTLPVMLPGAACAAVVFERRGGPARRAWLWAAMPLGLVFLAGQKILFFERGHRGTARQFEKLTAAVGHGPGALFVYSGPVLLYPASGRPALTRYIFPSHLQFRREAGSIGVDQRAEIERIMARRPAIVVLAPAIEEEEPALRDLLKQRLWQAGYMLEPPLLLGRENILIFRRPASTSRPSSPAAR